MFDWQTGDDSERLDQPILSPSRKGWVRRRLPTAVFLILILLIGGTINWLNRRADAAMAAAEQNVLLTHQLIQQAALDGDNELFTAMLFPETEWALLQQELVADDLFFNRGAMGLWYENAPHVPIATLSPDLTRAEVSASFLYEGAVVLEKTAVYQHNGSSWQLAPPDEAFWGDWNAQQEGDFILHYRERDEAIARQLAPDLAQVMVDLCTIATCPDDFSLQLTLSDDPHSLLPFNAHYRAVTLGDDGLILPSPTLIGVPTDEIGYAALRDGYAGWMVAVLLHEFERIDPPSHPQDPAVALEKLGLTLPPIARATIAAPAQTLVMQCGADVWAYDGAWTAVLQDVNGRLQQTTTGDPFYVSGAVLYGWDDGFAPVITATERLIPFPPSRFPQFEGGWVDGNGWHESEARLIWSPDGRYTLLIIDDMIWLGDGAGRPLQTIENGRSPFWIDHASYGYLRENGDVVQLTLADSVLPEMMEPTITAALLLDELPVEKRPLMLVLDGITAVSVDRWLIESDAGVFVFNPQTAVVEAVVLVDEKVAIGGRFLAHHENGMVQIYDLGEGVVDDYATLQTAVSSLAWSGDGEWLLIADEGMLRLIEARSGNEAVIEHGMGCETAVFVEIGH